MGFFIRWLMAFGLIAATFNPTEYSFFNWVREDFTNQVPLKVFLGLLLLIGFVIYLRATLRSIGGAGMILVGALLTSLIWVMIDWRWLTWNSRDTTIWFAIFVVSTILGIGLSWSIVRRTISGQYTEDEADD